MLSIPGVAVVTVLYESVNSLVYRAIREADNQPVILKLLKESYPTPQELLRYRTEYRITRELKEAGVVRVYDLQKYQNTLVIFVEDFGGESLKIWMQQRSFTLEEFLLLAIAATETLGQIHAANIIHKDINPSNIVYNPETGQLKIIDFGISTQLSRETPSLKNPNVLEGTLAYISPEQTGRMNRALDYRTDFYSLGVTFYELLTGKLPFETEDALELVHCHIARHPVSAQEIEPRIPLIVSQIVNKLMAKNAENRYQTAGGLKHDLEKCLVQLQEAGNIEQFALGTRDITDRFLIPEKLYGRETEVFNLLAAFERVSTGSAEMMLVAGFSGIGKTAVVNEVHKPIARQRGYFIKGKYDQFQRNIPFSAFVQAFRELMGQLLSESDPQLHTWKTKILTAVGESGQVLIEVIPELERIIGAQPTALELSGSAAQNRFNLLMQKFVQVFTSSHPLVMFLDDLQWADLASLKLLQLLMEDRGHLLVLGAYRDNEVSPVHPFMLTLDEIVKSGAVVNTITLQPLSLADMNQLVADTLICNLSLAGPLTELVYQKTQGNPFFSTQFLKSLYEDDQIIFDWDVRHWQCDIDRVTFADASDVVEFMAVQLQKLPKQTQDVLKLAACIGAQFDLDTLAVVSEELPEPTASALWKALQERLILLITEGYDLIQIDAQSPTHSIANPIYNFLHDRVQQAAYSLIPNDQKQATHLKIGQLLLQSSSDSEIEEKLFDIVGHLNQGIELINHLSEREALAQLNLEAGRKARSSTAYAAANIYLQMGIELLTPQCWQTQYELTLNLYVAAAEIAYLNGDFDGMEERAAKVLQKAQTILDRVKIYEIQIAAQTAQSKVLETIAVAREALLQLGIELPAEPDEALIGKALQALAGPLGGRKIEELVDLPVMTNPQTQAAMQLSGMLFPPIFQGMPGLLPLLSSTMVSLSLSFGNAPASTVGYAMHGMVFCAFFGDVETGYGFGQLALSLLDRLNVPEFKSTVLLLFGGWIQHRQESLLATIPTLKDGFTAGMETGDFVDAGYNIYICFYTHLFAGVELDTWEPEIASYRAVMAQLKQYSALVYLDMIQQTVQNLRETRIRPDLLIGSAYDETVMIPKHYQDNEFTAIACACIYKLLLAYCHGNYTAALDHITQVKQYLMGVSGSVFVPIFHFYAALTHLALFPAQSAIEQTEILGLVETYQSTLQQWAQNAPMNYLHKWHLVEAERQRVLGNKAEAIEMYDRAIEGAKENKYVNDEALANELAAKFYWEWGKTKVAQAYIFEAYYCYVEWGATAKVTDLEMRYSQLLAVTKPGSKNTQTTVAMTTTGSGNSLDISAVMKASQAISGEILLDKLLSSLMKILIENAGAQRGYLILSSQEKLLIEAEGTIDDELVTVFQSIPVENCQKLSSAIVNYVSRTQESVVLDDAARSGQFTNDPYIRKHQPKSILCVPLINQSQIISIVYLENNLTAGAFTPERVELLKVLSGQAAISIQNSKLYTEVRENETRLTQFLEAMPVGIIVLKPSGTPYYVNQKAQQLLGKGVAPDATREQLAEVYQVYAADTSNPYPVEKMPVVRALNGESSTVNDIEIYQTDKVVPIEAWGTPIYDNQSNIAYGLAAFQDITERKKAETEQIRFTNELFQLNKAYERFVPNQFLHFLEKSSIVDVELGDQVQLEMSVLFSDIRDFTTLSESMTPEDNFQFINAYLSRMESAIIENNGFIDKYIGDAIMALFSGNADNAVNASIAMLHQLQVYNQERVNSGYAPIKIGIGINTGNLMLGTVGGQNRMDTTVISDAVNLASRVEKLTKNYGVALLITQQTFNKLANPSNYAIRMIAEISVKGKVNLSTIYEVFDADIPETKRGKLATKDLFDRALILYGKQKFIEATEFFGECLKLCPSDRVAQIYLDWCEQKTITLNIELLERTLTLIKPQSDEFVSNFYEILFNNSSQIKSLFMNTKMAQQKEKLWQSLEIILENLRKPKLINVFAKKLGATHAKHGVSVEHYPVVANALIQALKSQMGLEWTPETEKAWVEAYKIIQSAMIDGMGVM